MCESLHAAVSQAADDPISLILWDDRHARRKFLTLAATILFVQVL